MAITYSGTDLGTEEPRAVELGGEVRPPISAQAMERLFLHDLMNTVSGLHVLARLFQSPGLAEDQRDECRTLFTDLTANLIDEIQHHRKLLLAERGELEPEMEEIALPEFLRNLRRVCVGTVVGKSRTLRLGRVPDLTVRSDAVLLRRSIVNLIKNAREATPAGGMVTLSCLDGGRQVEFRVVNPGVMPDEVKDRLFRGPFSTKQGADRGLGTYSVRLFVERYLHGRVWFRSNEEEGTIVGFGIPAL